ncbi:MAG: DUF4388 domain-containing protein [Thermoanaerobaculaceae bacterium]|nr:DUF4388 domain-containing protein [Thermoanaerobaculaceae bacterium]
MALKGELKTMLLPDVIQWLVNGLKTGILHLRSPKGVTKKVYFDKGRILSTASSDPREYLGQFLISRGLISEKQLNMAMETQFKSGIKLGKILIMAGILDENELSKMLRLKAEETLYDLFLWDEGEFIFEELKEIKEDFVPISLDATSLILEGIRRKDEWGRISKLIKSTKVVLSRKGKLSEAKEEISSFEMRTLEAIDGIKSLEEIALELHATDFNICFAAYCLCSKGLAEIKEEKKSQDEISVEKVHSKIISEAKKLMAEEKLTESINLLKFHLRKNKDKEAEKLLKEVENRYAEKYLKNLVPNDAVLELNVSLDKLATFSLSPKEGFLATRINGIYNVSQLVKISPIPENEALASIKKLLDLKIVKIKQSKNS